MSAYESLCHLFCEVFASGMARAAAFSRLPTSSDKLKLYFMRKSNYGISIRQILLYSWYQARAASPGGPASGIQSKWH